MKVMILAFSLSTSLSSSSGSVTNSLFMILCATSFRISLTFSSSERVASNTAWGEPNFSSRALKELFPKPGIIYRATQLKMSSDGNPMEYQRNCLVLRSTQKLKPDRFALVKSF